jgi:hypothetical protein
MWFYCPDQYLIGSLLPFVSQLEMYKVKLKDGDPAGFCYKTINIIHKPNWAYRLLLKLLAFYLVHQSNGVLREAAESRKEACT